MKLNNGQENNLQKNVINLRIVYDLMIIIVVNIFV